MADLQASALCTPQPDPEAADRFLAPRHDVLDSPYVYAPLSGDEIRLLEAVNQDGNLAFHLEHVSLDKAPPYTALSYCWGDPTPSQEMICDNLKLPITESVKILLPYIAPAHGSMHLWLDAICIDQANVKEKNHQVQMMGNIYKRASDVTIWLGEGNEIVANAMKIMPEVIAWSEKTVRLTLGQEYEGPPDQTFCEGIHFLFSRPWFTRLWTFQEAVLAGNVKISCGSASLPGELLGNLLELLYRFNTPLSCRYWLNITPNQQTSRGMTAWRRIKTCREFIAINGFVDLSVLLLYGKDQEASVLHDKIYAVLGLASPEIQRVVSVSYESSYECVLPDIISACLKLPGKSNSTLLNLSIGIGRDIPSWCPDVMDKVDRGMLATLKARSFSAGLYRLEDTVQHPLVADGSQIIPPEGANPKILLESSSFHKDTFSKHFIQLNGFSIDSVSKAVPFTWNPAPLDDPYKAEPDLVPVCQWEDSCMDLSREIFNNAKTMHAAHYRTITHAYKYMDWSKRKSYDCFKALTAQSGYRRSTQPRGPFSAWLTIPFGYFQLSKRKLYVHEIEAGAAIYSEIASNGKGRSFFSTSKGTIGIGPLALEPGDKVCIFHQAQTPFIIRPTQEDPTIYHLLGDAYVDGMMYGEAFGLEESKRTEVITLV